MIWDFSLLVWTVSRAHGAVNSFPSIAWRNASQNVSVAAQVSSVATRYYIGIQTSQNMFQSKYSARQKCWTKSFPAEHTLCTHNAAEITTSCNTPFIYKTIYQTNMGLFSTSAVLVRTAIC